MRKFYHFRIMLFITSVGYLMYDLARIIKIILFVSCLGLYDQQYMKTAAMVHMTFSSFYTFSWVFLIIERAIALVFVDVYEKRFAGLIVPTLAFFATTIISALITVVRYTGTAENFDRYLLVLELALVVFSFAALIVILTFNKSSYRQRHNSQMRLTNRYQLDENIRAGNYLMPVALNQVLVKVRFEISVKLSVFHLWSTTIF
ncbi:hypothetical protein COOONC_20554 [Cooperia oncophora]